jgi:hypothetical protein
MEEFRLQVQGKFHAPLAEDDPEGWTGSAVFSPCGKYRYELRREWPNGNGGVLVGMLNPSDASATEDDPTVRRLRSFVRAMRKKWFAVWNLFAWATPYPEELIREHKSGTDIVGPDNDATIKRLVESADMIIVAWGNCSDAPALARSRARELVSPGGPLHGRTLHTLRVTSSGAPGHPVRLPSGLVPVEYPLSAMMEWIEPKAQEVVTLKKRKW